MARAGTIALAGRAFNKVILTGHSYGSILANTLNQEYPDDVDAMILTGFSSTFKTSIPGVFANGVLLPADLFIPTDTSLPVEYQAATSQQGVVVDFYYGGYDPAIAAYDYSIRGTVAIGELISCLFSIVTAPSYNPPVYVVTGSNDYIFCNPTGLPNGDDCSPSGPGYLNQTASLYPAASVFEWYAVPDSGHCWQFHYAAAETFVNIHNWLAAQGF